MQYQRNITKSNAGDITILCKDFTLKFNPTAFDIRKVRQYKDRADAGVRFEVSPHTGSSDSNGNVVLSTQYVLKADLYLGKDTSPIDYLNTYMELALEYDKTKADLRRISQVALYRYNDYDGKWQQILKHYDDRDIAIRAFIDRIGHYVILGSRR